MDDLARVAHAIQSNPGVFALLLGSGLSKAAGVPTGWDITLELVKSVAVLEGDAAEPDPAAWWQAKHGGEPSYSNVLKALAPTPAERRRLIAGWIEATTEDLAEGRKRPTIAHRAVAELAAKGFLRVIITTNFDRLIEQALSEVGIEPTVISSGDDAKGAEPLVHSRVTLIKVHGDYLDTRIKNTEVELAKLDSGISKTLDRILDEFGLIVCGWSGVWDEGLRSAIARAPSRRYPTYWLHRSALDLIAADLLKARKGKGVVITDADAAFSKIAAYVAALENLQAPAPGDVNMLEAVAKKFIVDERHRISLHDLVVDEVKRARASVEDEAVFPPNVQPTNEVIRKRFEIAANISARLRRLVFVLTYHGANDHADTLRVLFQRLGSAQTKHTSYDVYRDIACVPAAYATYALTVGSILSNRFEKLAAVMSVRYKQNEADRDVIGVGVANAASLNALNPIDGQNYHAPFSHFVRPVMAAEAERVGVIGDEFDLAFDKAEVLHCMLHGHFKVTQGSHFWGPIGDFGWKQRSSWQFKPIAEWLEATEAAGSNGAMVKAGLFEGKPEVFKATLAGFNELLSHVRWR